MAHERLAEQQLESFLADAEGYADRLLRPAGESQKMMAARRDVLLRRLNIIKKLHQRGVLPVEKMELFYLERTLREGAPGILSSPIDIRERTVRNLHLAFGELRNGATKLHDMNTATLQGAKRPHHR